MKVGLYTLLLPILWPLAQAYKSCRRLGSVIRDLPRIVLKREPFEPGWQKKLECLRSESKLAFVSATPNGIVEFSLKNLLSGLAECGFATVLTVGPKDEVSNLIGDSKRIVVLRRSARCGRDFGIWKYLIMWLRSDAHTYNSVDQLLLANDSLYFTEKTSELLRALECSPHSWSCLYESFTPYYHPQSFLLLFKRPSLQQSAFFDFWRDYIPLENRKHLISKGEINFGKVMVKTVGAPFCLFSASRISSALGAEWKAQGKKFIVAAKRSAVLMKVYTSGKRYDCDVDVLSMRSRSSAETGESAPFQALIKDAVEGKNPTHAIGLLANICLGSPLKRDLVSSWTYRVSDIEDYSNGYSNNEKEAIRDDLLRKCCSVANGGLAQIWQALTRE